MTPRVREILGWYGSDNPGTLANISRMLNSGNLAGTGKMVILPVDQGFEHGPARSFAKNPVAYDPSYHFELAIESGCNAYAAPLGSLESCARDFAGEIPLILKVNNSDTLFNESEPISALTSSVEDALRLGCVAIGFTIYPGSARRKIMYEEIAKAAKEAKKAGLAVVIWSYPRGGGLDKQAQTALDVVAYAAQVACQLGAHIVKVKPPTDYIALPEQQKVYSESGIPREKLSSRVRHIVDACFCAHRIVIFSGAEAKEREAVLAEVRELARGGSFGSIMGRNAFQRPQKDAVTLLKEVQSIYRGE